MDYKRLIAKNIRLDGVSEDEIYNSLATPPELKNGEYTLPCFKFSKALKKAPQLIAESLKASFPACNSIQNIEAISGYLNFKLNRVELVKSTVQKVLNKGEKFCANAPNGKTICIDYSSVNIAKPFHMGHLLTTAIGGALYRIYKYLGYNVVGINHLGDWGTQFGKLIVAYKLWGSEQDVEKRGITALLELYVKFHEMAEKDDSLNESSREWFKKIEDGDAEATSIFNNFKQVTLAEVKKVYTRLGIEFDSYAGESFYNSMLDDVVKELEEKHLLTDSSGAKVVNLDEYNMPPCLILKSDGASLYATRDLAAAKYRKKEYDFYKCLYVVAYQQNLHFNQVFKVLELMGYDWASSCVHVPFGMVSTPDGALSTRKGNVVFLIDVLDAAVKKAGDIIKEKNPSLAGAAEVSENVGVGAIVFSALSSSRIKDTVFSLEHALEFDGETAPYIQYTHARACSIIAKVDRNYSTIDFSELTDDESFEVIKILDKFEQVVLEAANAYEPSMLARYLISLSQAFNKFYMSHRIIGEADAVCQARLCLTECVKNTLKNGLELILIKAPEKM